MRRSSSPALGGTAFMLPLMLCSSLALSQTEKKVQAVVAEPATIEQGQSTTLRWYFTGKKVTVSGGRFGKGVVVTGRTTISDKPTKTTKYTFDVDYVGEATNKVTGKREMMPLHTSYTVVAEVIPPIST